jgi:antitoxin MazE
MLAAGTQIVLVWIYADIHEILEMKLQVSKWGNSLAVRLPAEYARAVGVREGDNVEAEINTAGEITLTPKRNFDKTAFLKRIRKLRAGMPMTSPTVEAMRQDDRY